MKQRIVIDVDRDGWTKNLQLNIATLNENDRGWGFRLAGPKYNGSSKNLLRTELDERDAAEIRKALDTAFPLPDKVPHIEALVAKVAETITAFDTGDWPSTKDEIGYLRDALNEYREATTT